MTPSPRIKSQVRVQSWLRRCAAQGLMAVVVRSGDADAGAILVKVNRFAGGCDVFAPVTAPDGSSAWLRALGPAPKSEKDADAYIARQVGYDSDLWVVEIEDPHGRFVFDEPVLAG
ncbi:MAG: DUF1491 family protein [Rhodospirillaceae bacterium]|nr:DUF1491 family protein [Rhodospirillaceae bacterium]